MIASVYFMKKVSLFQMTIALLLNLSRSEPLLNHQLLSIINQSQTPDELFVLDSTGDNAIPMLCNQMQTQVAFTIEHLSFSEAIPFATKINAAVLRSEASYIVVLNEMSFLHPKCLQQHLRWARRGLFLSGVLSKVSLVHSLTHDMEHPLFMKKIRSAGSAVYFPGLSAFASSKPSISDDQALQNVSFWREDFNLINGYDEMFETVEGVTRDMLYRLIQLGIESKVLKASALIYKPNTTEHQVVSQHDAALLRKSLQKKRIVAINGLEKTD